MEISTPVNSIVFRSLSPVYPLIRFHVILSVTVGKIKRVLDDSVQLSNI